MATLRQILKDNSNATTGNITDYLSDLKVVSDTVPVASIENNLTAQTEVQTQITDIKQELTVSIDVITNIATIETELTGVIQCM